MISLEPPDISELNAQGGQLSPGDDSEIFVKVIESFQYAYPSSPEMTMRATTLFQRGGTMKQIHRSLCGEGSL